LFTRRINLFFLVLGVIFVFYGSSYAENYQCYEPVQCDEEDINCSASMQQCSGPYNGQYLCPIDQAACIFSGDSSSDASFFGSCPDGTYQDPSTGLCYFCPGEADGYETFNPLLFVCDVNYADENFEHPERSSDFGFEMQESFIVHYCNSEYPYCDPGRYGFVAPNDGNSLAVIWDYEPVGHQLGGYVWDYDPAYGNDLIGNYVSVLSGGVLYRSVKRVNSDGTESELHGATFEISSDHKIRVVFQLSLSTDFVDVDEIERDSPDIFARDFAVGDWVDINDWGFSYAYFYDGTNLIGVGVRVECGGIRFCGYNFNSDLADPTFSNQWRCAWEPIIPNLYPGKCPDGYVYSEYLGCYYGPYPKGVCIKTPLLPCLEGSFWDATAQRCADRPLAFCPGYDYGLYWIDGFDWSTGRCEGQGSTYTCPLDPSYPCIDTGSGAYCSPYQCIDVDDPNNVQNTDTTEGANDRTDDGPRDSNGSCLGVVRIFNGQDMRCRPPGLQTGWSDCCRKSRTWFGLGQCGAREQQLAKFRTTIQYRGQERDYTAADARCHYVGDYCAEKIPLAGCVQKKKTYCCFGSPLARIIQEQGRPQLGKGWGDPKSPDCSGFTIDEFQKLDFSKIDFSEWINMIVGQETANLQNNLPNQTQDMQQNIQNMYR
jgi:hypothetical protein